MLIDPAVPSSVLVVMAHPDGTLQPTLELRRDVVRAILAAAGYEPHKVLEIFIANAQDPNCVVDVGDTLETKIAALCEHRSQVSEERLREFVPLRAAQVGERFGLGHAEAFHRIELS